MAAGAMGLTGASWVCLVMGVTVYARTICRGIRTVCRGYDDGSGMALTSSCVRFGAAAFVVGLSLAGPQAVGVAAADSSDAAAESSDAASSVGVREARAPRSAAVRAERGSRSAAAVVSPAAPGAGTVRVARSAEVPRSVAAVVSPAASADGAAITAVRASGSVKPASAVADRRRSHAALTVEPGSAVPSVLDVAPSLPEVAAALPSAAAVAVDPARVPARAQRGAAPRVTVPPVLTGDVVATVGFAIERFLDTSVLWLSGLPSNPITDFLTGALWLVRRTLFPVGDAVGLGGVPTGLAGSDCVAAKDCSGLDLTGADFAGRDLTGVKFIDTDLTKAIFGAGTWQKRLDLSGVDFTGATLTGAYLGFTDLRKATLTSADLSSADLTAA